MCSGRFPWMPVLMIILTYMACMDRGGQPVESLNPRGLPTSYHYSAYNANGDLAVNGTITLTTIDSSSVSGTWLLLAVIPSDKIGPQTGTGKLVGSIQKSSISINLNPDWVDNNVFLQGTVSPDSINGRWMWSTFIGPTAEGEFKAIRTIPTHITNN